MAEQPPFTEPVPIPCLFVSGTATEFMPGFARVVAWVELPTLPAEPHERRIVGRWVMPDAVARQLERDLHAGLRKSRS
jgi:hypothetical protein